MSTFGTCSNDEENRNGWLESQCKYNHLSRRQLRYHLNEQKNLHCDETANETRFISKLLRLKYSKRTYRILSVKNYDERIQENFWKYCKKIFEDENTVLPDFDEQTCTNFFRSQLTITFLRLC